MKRYRHGKRVRSPRRKNRKGQPDYPLRLAPAQDQHPLLEPQSPPPQVSEKEAESLLSASGLEAKKHWAKHLPKLFASLVQQNRLNRALYLAQELTLRAVHRYRENGVPANQALSLVSQEWLLPPSEDERRLENELAGNLEPDQVLASYHKRRGRFSPGLPSPSRNQSPIPSPPSEEATT